MRGYLDHEVKHNPSKVYWQAHIYEGNGSGNETTEPSQIVGVHECDDADYAKFYDPSPAAE